MKPRVFAGLVAAALSACAAWAHAQPAEDWRALAVQDVRAAYDIFAANHPGMHDPTNRGFPVQLGWARDRALAVAERAASQSGYAEALGTFSSGLGDGHAQVMMVQPPAGAQVDREWPGFTVAWRGSALFVHAADPAAPAPAGAAIVACNGRPIRDYLRRRLLTRNFRPAEAGQWWFWSTRAFVSTPTTAEGRPERCAFRVQGGRAREAALSWRPAPTDLDARLAAASDGERTPIGLGEPRPGLFLIGMPDFNPDEAGAQAWRRLYDELTRRRAELARARAIVIDLRHNNGGSSLWSRDAARILWGREAVDRRMARHFREVAIWWRASRGNTEYMEDLIRRLEAMGRTSQADASRGSALGMRAALDRGETFYVQPIDDDESADAPGALPATDLRTPVYVIVPGRCASACNDALDVFTRFSNVRLIGAPGSGDSTYMEARATELPSGRGRIVIPNKIWMNRPRASGEYYRPDVGVNDLDWSTATFLDRIEHDLRSRR
ncbi:MAG TPA: S41 family peptidase [Allosphingosinicella sp.]|nr:S41 family peptidase [Allosphingosinicella sp.]